MDKIIIKGARENNLKNINLELPKNKLIVMTGVSGSGKSSLAFDTIYAEGQRRYVESLSAYARQFLGGTDKPDVDSIEGLSPSISIDQKTTNNNPRSTVGTVTEIYDYLRLLYARIGIPYCPVHNKPISSQSIEEMTNQILELDTNTKIRVLSPVVHGEKGTQVSVLEDLKKDGFQRVRIDNTEYDLTDTIELSKTKKHNIDVVIDRLIIREDIRSRLYEAIELACKLSKGKCVIDVVGKDEIVMSEKYACPSCDFSLPELEPRLFSFNAPYGACPACNGLGVKQKISVDLLIPDKNKSILDGGIVAYNMDASISNTQMLTLAKNYNIDLSLPIKDLKEEELDLILYGSDKPLEFNYTSNNGNTRTTTDYFEGVVNNLERRYIETKSGWIREWLDKFMMELPCEMCHGARLNDSVLAVKINKKNIYELTCMSIGELYDFFNDLKLNNELLNKKIADLSSYELMCFKLLTIINKKPSIIILDNVDCKICEKYKSKLLNFIRLINASKRIKFIIISSNTVFLNQISKDCLVMKNGIIKYEGQIIDGIKSDQIKKCEIIDFIDIANQKKNAKLDYYLETKELLKAIYRSVF